MTTNLIINGMHVYLLKVIVHARTHAHTHTHTVTHTHTFYSPLNYIQDYPGEPAPEPIYISLKQETVSGTGISWVI